MLYEIVADHSAAHANYTYKQFSPVGGSANNSLSIVKYNFGDKLLFGGRY
jgi:hypothetical protein